MYTNFFDLSKEPFSISPDPSFLAVLPQTREALASLEYAISFRKGIVVLIGEVGTGKTMLLRASLDAFRRAAVHFAYVFNPKLDVLDFLEFVLVDFGMTPETRSKAAMLLQLNRWLLEMYSRRETCVIIVDEAQGCSVELLEEIRLLTNLETASEKLIQVILSGQPELETKLRQENVRQLRQRVALWCRTFPLDQSETKHYIEERLRIAGARREIFTSAAVRRIFELSGGIPRVVNLLCEHSFILAYVHQQTTIGSGVVDAVAQDLLLNEPSQGKSVEHPGIAQSSDVADASEKMDREEQRLQQGLQRP